MAINEALSVNRKADAGFYNKTRISNKIKKNSVKTLKFNKSCLYIFGLMSKQGWNVGAKSLALPDGFENGTSVNYKNNVSTVV